MSKPVYTSRSIALLIILSTMAGFSATRQTALSPQWILGEDAQRATQLPIVSWLADNTVVLYDIRRPEEQRTFEKLNPRTGQHIRLLNMAQALDSLKRYPDIPRPVSLPWPEDFNSAGTKAVYLLHGDIFVLDLHAANFVRLTSTAAEEKCVRFSPNGRQVSFVRANNLYVFDLVGRTEQQLTKDGSDTLLNGTLSWVYREEIFDRNDAGYWWSPDSHAIAFLQTDDSMVPESTFVDFRGDGRHVIHQRYPKAGEANPRARVGVVEVGTHNVLWVNIKDRPYEWVVGIKWSPDGARLSVQTENRLQTELRLYFVNRRSKTAKRVLIDVDPIWVNDRYDHLHFVKEGKSFLWVSERDGYMHLYRYHLDGALVSEVTSGASAPRREQVVGIDANNEWIYFSALGESVTDRQLYRIKFDGRCLLQLSRQAGTHNIVMSQDAQYYLDTFSDTHTPPSLRLFASDGSLLQTISLARRDFLPTDLQFPELLTIPAADGFPMPAQILKPIDFNATRKYPVILYIYGGPAVPVVRNAWQSDNVVPGLLFNNMMAGEGYIMVSIDDRAATGISKKLEDTMAKDPVGSETADWLAGVQWLKAQPWVDGDRIGVWGWSGGGSNTLNLMTHSKEFKAGIAVAPTTDIRFYDSKFAEWLYKLPQDNREAYDRASPLKHAANLSGRLMLVYGTNDDNVHPQNEEAFINALVEAGKSFDLLLYPMRKHDIADHAAKAHLYEQMREFWKKHL